MKINRIYLCEINAILPAAVERYKYPFYHDHNTGIQWGEEDRTGTPGNIWIHYNQQSKPECDCFHWRKWCNRGNSERLF